MVDEPADHERSEGRRPRLQARGLVVGFMVGSIIALVATVTGIILMRRPLPTVTLDDVDAAIQRWDANAPAKYQMTIEIGGNRPGTVHIVVENDTVVSMTRDGRTPSQQRTWAYWTVPGQFDTILQDFDSAEDPVAGFGAAADSTTVLRGKFDPEFGYPLAYERIVLGEQLDVRWDVTEFQVLP